MCICDNKFCTRVVGEKLQKTIREPIPDGSAPHTTLRYFSRMAPQSAFPSAHA